ncbi:MAG: hypothetical protein HQ588_06285 [Deltaproteobacteria bacterium]|nr:hypothetical protein [Deltaproteobacteria bacterium]
MNRKVSILGLVVIIFGIIALAMGIVFVQQGFEREAWLAQTMASEQIALPDGSGTIVDSSALAEAAGDMVREHRHGIAPTYGDLLGGENFNPTDPAQLTYAQAMNIENYLYLAVTAFGVFIVVKAAGAFMIVMGLALGVTGYSLWSLGRAFAIK